MPRKNPLSTDSRFRSASSSSKTMSEGFPRSADGRFSSVSFSVRRLSIQGQTNSNRSGRQAHGLRNGQPQDPYVNRPLGQKKRQIRGMHGMTKTPILQSGLNHEHFIQTFGIYPARTMKLISGRNRRLDQLHHPQKNPITATKVRTKTLTSMTGRMTSPHSTRKRNPRILSRCSPTLEPVEVARVEDTARDDVLVGIQLSRNTIEVPKSATVTSYFLYSG